MPRIRAQYCTAGCLSEGNKVKYYELSGVWTCSIPGQTADISIPGTLDESGIGHPDTNAAKWHPDAAENAALADCGVIATRLTRNYTYEGPARIERRLSLVPPAGKRVFAEVERARCLKLFVNGTEAADFVPPTISTPHIFEITGLLTGNNDSIVFESDNSYPGLPRDAIVYSSAATDETQTNWNGLLGYVRLRFEEEAFIQAVYVRPRGDKLEVSCEISAPEGWHGRLKAESDALEKGAETEAADGTAAFGLLPLKSSVRRWDEGEGCLYTITVSGDTAPVTVTFGVRDFDGAGGRLRLNGRNIFLRSEANCAVFPETGYPPMTEDEWERVLEVYRSYGVNCMRFHSHMPPEAAFAAADRMGMLMQPELPHWNPRNAFEDDIELEYYRRELPRSIKWLCNHPSFVMLTLGNEPAAGEKGHTRMTELLRLARDTDSTRLYANGSNPHYGSAGCDPESDFYAAQSYHDKPLRAVFANMEGYLNHSYPSAARDYSETLVNLRETYSGPVFSFEVGQYEVLPDFDEIAEFNGVTRPGNLELIRGTVRSRGLETDWKRRVEATGMLSRICYREEIEAALRTDGLSGISLLGLQDFPGQGTALVGMLNSHLNPKPFEFARPEDFSAFFSGERTLALLPRYTFEAGETLTAPVRFANYGKAARRGKTEYTLSDGKTTKTGACGGYTAAAGGLSDIGVISAELSGFAAPSRLELTVAFDGTKSTYPLWLYPRVMPVCPESVHEARRLDAAALSVLEAGGAVFLAPDSTESALPGSVKAQFSTDFWSVGTFSSQSGAMGQLIDEGHPVFSAFPTSYHTDWQWWPMAVQRAVIVPDSIKPIITEVDSYAYLRHMAQLFECRCAGGRLMFSSMGLHNLVQYPEVRALLASIYSYLGSGAFAPEQYVAPETIAKLVNQRPSPA